MGESEAMVRSIIAQRGPSAGAFELLGLIRMAANDVPGAKRLFEQAVYLEPARTASLLQLAMIGERAGDPHRAAAYWERARRASATQEAGR
jgi:chemotaxis protein methyltransferase WspC